MAEPAGNIPEDTADDTRGAPQGERGYATLSGEPVEPVYRPADLDGFDPAERLGAPGEYPFTRGVYPSMYRGRLWTMRQFAGFGTAAETNARYQFLLEQRTGRAVGGVRHADADGPTTPTIRARRARSGAAASPTDSLEDFETLFDGIPLGDISTSMTISGPAVVVFAFFLADGGAAGRAVGASWTARCRPTS